MYSSTVDSTFILALELKPIQNSARLRTTLGTRNYDANIGYIHPQVVKERSLW